MATASANMRHNGETLGEDKTTGGAETRQHYAGNKKEIEKQQMVTKVFRKKKRWDVDYKVALF